MGDIRDEWRIRDVEQKAERANSRLNELDSLRGDVASLERSVRELSSCNDGLRNEIQAAIERIQQAESLISELTVLREELTTPAGCFDSTGLR